MKIFGCSWDEARVEKLESDASLLRQTIIAISEQMDIARQLNKMRFAALAEASKEKGSGK